MSDPAPPPAAPDLAGGREQLAAAENWLRRVAEVADQVCGSRKAMTVMAEYDRCGRIAEAADALLVRWYGEDSDDDAAWREVVREADPVLFELIYALGAVVGGLDV